MDELKYIVQILAKNWLSLVGALIVFGVGIWVGGRIT